MHEIFFPRLLEENMQRILQPLHKFPVKDEFLSMNYTNTVQGCYQCKVISKQAGPTLRVAISFILSTRSTSSRALSHTALARANSFSANSSSLRVSSRTLSAYAFSADASLICSAVCCLST